ncbi:MAG TPA: DUF4349 domain-containing protein [Solirubrobacterales bacterium]|nr:DUF4349 domain-containing protein [Solirubrobacterales bacterium]
MDRFDDDILAAELRALRPTPRPEFAATLDERAAAGFPRRQAPSAAAMPFALLADRWRALSPRRRLVPVLAVALAALAVATGIVAIVGSGSKSLDSGSEGQFLSELKTFGSEEGSRSGGGPESGGAAAAEAAPSNAAGVEPPQLDKSSKLSTHRDIERSAYVVLGTRPGEVAGAAAKVFEAVHAASGVVLHSKVRSGSAGATGASFELLIPSDKLGDALSAISSIAEVRERHDATDDITAPTVGAGEELRDSNASIEGLLKELGDVETEAERESVEARLREERRRHAAIRASLDHLHKRASMSKVTVRIVTDHGTGAAPPSKGDDGWGIGDAFHDAGRILTIAAGVVLLALAVLAPIALIALALWLANRLRLRRLRERTLG